MPPRSTSKSPLEHEFLILTAAKKPLTLHSRGCRPTRVVQVYIISNAMMRSSSRHLKNSGTIRKLRVNKMNRVTNVMPSLRIAEKQDPSAIPELLTLYSPLSIEKLSDWLPKREIPTTRRNWLIGSFQRRIVFTKSTFQHQQQRPSLQTQSLKIPSTKH